MSLLDLNLILYFNNDSNYNQSNRTRFNDIIFNSKFKIND